jgi:hypothetical protein
VIAPWLEAKRQQLGRHTRPDTCSHCGAPLLVGLDADLCALTATVDITMASAAEETAHLLAGGTSYDYIRGELHYRDHHRHREYPVLLSHVCIEKQPTLFNGRE